MKRTLAMLSALFLLISLLCGCGSTETQPQESTVDLAAMSDTLAFAEIANINTTPAKYLGKNIKIRGQYSSSFDDITQKYIHTVIIMDATSCCPQGLEFLWEGEHRYPADYPKEGAVIELAGLFQSYAVNGELHQRIVTDTVTNV